MGSVLQLTLVPTEPIENIPNTQLYLFAQQMKHINALYGVPVLLRFMHEMNGNWLTTYGQKPTPFKQAFVNMESYVHSMTNMTAMVWGPNVGAGYPFGASITKANNPDFDILDTNGDGVVNNLDDPYLPYWPGDDYVDWVAMSAYQYNHDGNGQSVPTDVDIFTSGTSQSGFNGRDETHSLYNRFAEGHNKPFMLGETGLAKVSSLQGTPLSGMTEALELAAKQSWWKAVFESTKQFKRFKSATWFEEIKDEESYVNPSVRQLKDYRITYNNDMVKAFVTDTDTTTLKITWSDHLNVTCAGALLVR